MTENEILTCQIEAWKTCVTVQQHFNDIEWKIRGVAFTLLTAVLSAAVVANADKSTVAFHGLHISLASALLFIGAGVWIMFYVVDGQWYHRLLAGAVRQAEELEKVIGESVPSFGLTTTISASSPSKKKFWLRIRHKKTDLVKHRFWWYRAEWHSRDRLFLLYFIPWILVVALAVLFLD